MGRQGPCPGVLTQENCRKVTRSVEDAEIKTNVLKQNSALLEVRGVGGCPRTGYRVLGWTSGGPFPPHHHPTPFMFTVILLCAR